MVEKRKRLGDLLVEANVITTTQLEKALQTKTRTQKLGDTLVDLGFITEQQLLEVLEYQLGVPRIQLSQLKVEPNALSLISKDAALRNIVLPLRIEGNRLITAMADPMDYFTIDEMRLATGFHIEPALALKDEIVTAIHKYYYEQDQVNSDTEAGVEAEALENAVQAGEEAPVIRIVNDLITYGIQQRASDIHIDPQEKSILIRYRVDGVLKTERSFAKSMQNVLTARIKIMADLNITETRLPQDGRIKTTLSMQAVDLRISTLPTVYGEKIVIRILDSKNALSNLTELGFNTLNYDRFKKLIERPSGMVLLTGPTGSGKSTTLYAALQHLNHEEVNIITVEDPVEYQLTGINQVQVNSEIGLTFAAGLRSILRQDPNIVMVGEIRDKETAEIAIRASLTGHLVLSTLHTNSAVASIPRLMDMGVEPYMVVSSVSGVAAQRLVRKVCPNCKEAYEPSEMEIDLFTRRGLKPGTLFKGAGCSSCGHTGYRGRIAIHELLVMDDTIRGMLMNQETVTSIRKYVTEEGMIFLIDDGLLKAKKGQTTIEEVLRVALDE
ncbi:GspE/PulE family protein [Bacillus piscicola]|uniref:GspE/PulE family protein n=1 Tax=Bacillus piscicola TaxID=1632684 RepID=UPI001F097DA5|nr:ATPase, T2SS/T4P/T4SS family [Bacillus piscicola]